MLMLRFYRTPALSPAAAKQLSSEAAHVLGLSSLEVGTEWCYYAQSTSPLDQEETWRLQWLLSETFAPRQFGSKSFVRNYRMVLEVGPRLNFETAWSTTAVSICHACGLSKVVRLERSRRFGLSERLSPDQAASFLLPLHDRMTEMPYPRPLKSFATGQSIAPVRIIPVLEQGKDALRQISRELGLGWDEQDIEMYYDLFVNILKRNPTDVELYQLGQANSEHSRHGFFKGRLVIDGQPIPEENLMAIVKEPWRVNPRNSQIAFCDDSSAISGDVARIFIPYQPGEPSNFRVRRQLMHPTLTAETHNFPSGVEPYEGAKTGIGGRLRDDQAVGRGGYVGVGGAGYCVGNLHIPGYNLPWEEDGHSHPENLASPLDILIRASDGASVYGNCFGESVIYGFTRTFGMTVADEYRSWYKPIMYTVGAGQINDCHVTKGEPKKGMLVVQIGGPAYRIGLGGGSASSMVQGDNALQLDFNAVQRGDPQMEQRMNRIVRACIELLDKNPIVSIHDLGAGGDCNALPEIVCPAGARLSLRTIPVGDRTLSVLEIWCNESQERNALLIWPESFDRIKAMCEREDVPCAIVGQITDDNYLVLFDENDGTTPVNLPLDKVLGSLPPKTFHLKRIQPKLQPLMLPEGLTVRDALERVLRLPAVGSKRFLTTKVDRSVTGLIAQQQCVGPNQLTLSDYAVAAWSYFGLNGTALSLGEQPIKGLINPQAMARLAVAEMVLNMASAKISSLADIKCSANWMWAAKEPGEGAQLYDAACAMRDFMLELGLAVDGGKDSLTMAAKAFGQLVKGPGQLVIAGYAPMSDLTRKVTPDLKHYGSALIHLDLSGGKRRLGGSALAQVFQQVGNDCPDVEDADLLVRTFQVVQFLVESGLVCAVHDCSDGGLITTLLEMAFAGNKGLDVHLESRHSAIKELFAEEPGLVLQCGNALAPVAIVLKTFNVPSELVALPTDDLTVRVRVNNELVLDDQMTELRQLWESTSTALDRHQANPACVDEEAKINRDLVTWPPYRLSFEPQPPNKSLWRRKGKPTLAVIRERGSNGDREMAAAWYMAGFKVKDVIMTDLLAGNVDLKRFRGVVFPGGFAFADVLDAGKGWAGVIRFNDLLYQQFQEFSQRPDTFSLGVCNGCQLMALLGWVPWPGISMEQQPRFIRNTSGRFESRFPAVEVLPSPAIMLQGMAGSIMGIWQAHGEGRLHIPDAQVAERIVAENLAPLRFVDDWGKPTTAYPFNPNGSPDGITALCSPDGRHLAMMPHLERTFLPWQWPYWPERWQGIQASPWHRMFQNAYDWCQK